MQNTISLLENQNQEISHSNGMPNEKNTQKNTGTEQLSQSKMVESLGISTHYKPAIKKFANVNFVRLKKYIKLPVCDVFFRRWNQT